MTPSLSWIRRSGALGAATLLAAAVISTPAQAVPLDPEVDPGAARVLLIEPGPGPVEDLAFPAANADGSVTDYIDEIVLQADVFFAYNDAALTDRARSELAAVVDRIEGSSVHNLSVTGHTDSDGTDAHNLDLSRRRAQSVRDALAAGLPGVTIVADGRGEAEPVATNDTDEGRALNRRVTIGLG